MRLAQQKITAAQGRPRGHYDDHPFQWGVVNAVQGGYESTLAEEAAPYNYKYLTPPNLSGTSTLPGFTEFQVIRPQTAPQVGAILGITGVPGTYAVVNVASDEAEGYPWVVALQSMLPQTAPAGATVASLDTLDNMTGFEE
jgi:hypothetical protein